MNDKIHKTDEELARMSDSEIQTLFYVDRNLHARAWKIKNEPDFLLLEREKEIAQAEKRREREFEITRREAALKNPLPEPATVRHPAAPTADFVTVGELKAVVRALSKTHARVISDQLAKPHRKRLDDHDTKLAALQGRLDNLETKLSLVNLAAGQAELTETLMAPVVPQYSDGKLIAATRSPQSRASNAAPITVTQSTGDPRTFEVTLSNGTRSFFYVPIPVWKGTFQAMQSYVCGDLVTHKGSVWHCTAVATKSAPPCGDWQLMIQKGADAKDGVTAEYVQKQLATIRTELDEVKRRAR